MFGITAQVGLGSSHIPKKLLTSIDPEDDLSAIIEEMNGTERVRETDAWVVYDRWLMKHLRNTEQKLTQ